MNTGASQGTHRSFVRLLTDSGRADWAAPIRSQRSPGGDPGDDAAGLRRPYFMVLATLLITPLTLVPTLPMAVIAATAISEAISVYSMAVAPLVVVQQAAKEGQHGNLPRK